MTRKLVLLPAAGVLILILASLCGLGGCGGPVDLSGQTAEELYSKGIEEYRNEKYLRAVDYLQTLVYNYPGESVIDTAQYYLAMSYFGNEDYALAGVEFNRLLINYPSSAFASHAQLMRAVCYYEGTPDHYGLDQSDLQLAIEQFQDFITDYPESEAVSQARAYLDSARTRLARKAFESGVVYTHVRDFRASKVYFQLVVDEYTNTIYAPLAAYQIAEGFFQQKKWDSAHEAFHNFTIVYSDHEQAAQAMERACEAAFKGGKAALDDEDYALAKKRFERFQTVCAGNGDRTEDVVQFLEKLKNLTDLPVADTADTANAGT